MYCRLFCFTSLFLALTLVQTVNEQVADPITGVSENLAVDEALPSQEAKALSNEKRTVFMARADWDTGWFQAEVFKQFLEELGYTVKGPVTMNSWDNFCSFSKAQ